MNDIFAYVGARTTRERNARGDGLNVYRLPVGPGAWAHVQRLGDLVNPSFLAFDRSRRYLYAVHGDRSEISAFAIDRATGRLAPLGGQSTAGRNPVHLAVDPTNRFVVVANHLTSTLALLPRNDDGTLGAVRQLVSLEGAVGPHRIEQPFAKPHQVEFDPSGRFIAVPDKGLDGIFVHRLDAAAGRLEQVSFVAAREGAGPRHIAFHPDGRHAYVINELDSTVAAYRFDAAAGRLAPFQIVSALPDTFTGNSRAAELAVTADGRFVLASNRGFDSIAVFAVDGASGRLSPVGWQASGGSTPRFFALADGDRRIFVANEDSDTIVGFTIDSISGALKPNGIATSVGSPTCILFLDSD